MNINPVHVAGLLVMAGWLPLAWIVSDVRAWWKQRKQLKGKGKK